MSVNRLKSCSKVKPRSQLGVTCAPWSLTVYSCCKLKWFLIKEERMCCFMYKGMYLIHWMSCRHGDKPLRLSPSYAEPSPLNGRSFLVWQHANLNFIIHRKLFVRHNTCWNLRRFKLSLQYALMHVKAYWCLSVALDNLPKFSFAMSARRLDTTGDWPSVIK